MEAVSSVSRGSLFWRKDRPPVSSPSIKQYDSCITLERTPITDDTVVYLTSSGGEQLGIFALSRSELQTIQKNDSKEPNTRNQKGWKIPNPSHHEALFDEQGILKSGQYSKSQLRAMLPPEISPLEEISFGKEIKEEHRETLMLLAETRPLIHARVAEFDQLQGYERINLAFALICLDAQHLLTPKNIDLAFTNRDWRSLFSFLHLHALLNEETLKKLYAYAPEQAQTIGRGFAKLMDAGIYTPENQVYLLKDPSDAFLIGSSFVILHEADLLTERNRKIMLAHLSHIGLAVSCLGRLGALIQENVDELVQHAKKGLDIGIALQLIITQGLLTKQETAILHWNPSPVWKPLVESLHKMFSYGVLRLADDQEKGMIAIRLALSLKRKLKEFLSLSLPESLERKEAFKTDFMTCLHSKNEDIGQDPKKKIEWADLIDHVSVGLFSALYLLAGVSLLNPFYICGGVFGLAFVGYSASRSTFFPPSLNRQPLVQDIDRCLHFSL